MSIPKTPDTATTSADIADFEPTICKATRQKRHRKLRNWAKWPEDRPLPYKVLQAWYKGEPAPQPPQQTDESA